MDAGQSSHAGGFTYCKNNTQLLAFFLVMQTVLAVGILISSEGSKDLEIMSLCEYSEI